MLGLEFCDHVTCQTGNSGNPPDGIRSPDNSEVPKPAFGFENLGGFRRTSRDLQPFSHRVENSACRSRCVEPQRHGISAMLQAVPAQFRIAAPIIITPDSFECRLGGPYDGIVDPQPPPPLIPQERARARRPKPG